MKNLLASLVMTILLSSCAVEKKKLTENVGKYIFKRLTIQILKIL